VENMTTDHRKTASMDTHLRIHIESDTFADLLSRNTFFTRLAHDPSSDDFAIPSVRHGDSCGFLDTRMSGENVLDLNREQILGRIGISSIQPR
jgi:hypothetical protein